MSKKNLFISAALTAFVLVVLTNLAAAYKQSNNSSADTQAALPIATNIVEVIPTETQPVALTHQEAALVAANFLGETDLFSVENALWNEIDAYKVVFSSGYTVYVGIDGQILSSEAPQPVFVSVPAPVSNNNGGSSQSQPASNNSQQERHDDHNEHDEHEEHDND